MNAFKPGQLVRHDGHAEWGLGRILMIDGQKAHAFFLNQPGNAAILFQTKDDGSPLKLAPEQSDPWLDNLPPFGMKDGRLRLSQVRLTKAQAMEKFCRRFPLGFRDETYLTDPKHGERQNKWQAHELFLELLGNGEAARLLAAESIDELARRVFVVAISTNLLHPSWDKAPLKDALKSSDALRPYLSALVDVVTADKPNQATFDAHVAALEKLPQPGTPVASWPGATIIPYLAQPDRHMLLRPSVTQHAAERFGIELNYVPRPNWRTYSSLLGMAAQLFKDLKPHGARDYIDVQSFIWVIGQP